MESFLPETTLGTYGQTNLANKAGKQILANIGKSFFLRANSHTKGGAHKRPRSSLVRLFSAGFGVAEN